MHFNETTCLGIDPTAIRPAAWEFHGHKIMVIVDRQHQIAVARNRTPGLDEMPHIWLSCAG
jgi:hypothetical protein